MLKKKLRAEKNRFLDPPDVHVPAPGWAASYCYYVVLVALAGAGALGCFFTAFEAQVKLPEALWAGAASVLLCTAQSLVNERVESKWKSVFPAALTAVWGFLLFRWFPEVVQGALHMVNLMLTAYGSRLRMTLPRLAVAAAGPQTVEANLTKFACLFEFPFFALLSSLFVRHHSALGAFTWTGLFLLAPLAFSILPADWALALLLLFWAFLLLSVSSMARPLTPLASDRQKIKLPGSAHARPVTLLLLPLFALCMAGIYKAAPPEGFERPDFVNEIRSQITGSFNLPAILKGGTGSGNHRVDLSNLGSRSYSGSTALRVRYRWADAPDESQKIKKEYLKSFVGGEYTGSSWELLNPDKVKEVDTLLDGKKSQCIAGSLISGLPMPDEDAAVYQLDVEKVNVDSRTIYAPYGLLEPEELPSGVRYASDGFLRSSRWLFGPKEYSLSAVAAPGVGRPLGLRFGNALVLPLKQDADGGSGAVKYGGALASIQSGDDGEGTVKLSGSQTSGQDEDEQWDKEVLRSYHDSFYAASSEGTTAADRFQIPQEVRELYDGGGLGAVNTAERYTDFAYENYLQLPENTRAFALRFLEEHRADGPSAPANPETIDRVALAAEVRNLLNDQCTYSLSPAVLPEGKEFVEFFLTDSREGYCVHFATAGVVLLRALGVPARYAEGYAVPVREDGGWARVPDKNSHAWAEIYCSGSGWLPVEMTPQNEDAPATYENAIGPKEQQGGDSTPVPSHEPAHHLAGLSPKPAPTVSPTPAPGTANPAGPAVQPEGKSGSPRVWLLSALFLLAAPFALLWLSRKLRIALRRRRFRQRDRNKAALCVYRHLLRLYRESYLLPYGNAEPPEEVTQLALKARFSSHVITEEELRELTARADELEAELERQLSPSIRLRRKYLSALF